MIRLLIVHEVPLIADLTASVLRIKSDIEVVTCVASVDAALTLLSKAQYDVLLVSSTLPNAGAMLLTRAVVQMDAVGKVLITGMLETKTVIFAYLEAGASGYIYQDEAVVDFVEKIRAVNRNEFPVSPALAAAFIARIRELRQQVTELNGLQALNTDSIYAKLSGRECEVLSLIEQGSSNQGVAHILCIEVGTVKNHVHNILDKLGVRTREQAAIIVRQTLAQAENARQN